MVGLDRKIILTVKFSRSTVFPNCTLIKSVIALLFIQSDAHMFPNGRITIVFSCEFPISPSMQQYQYGYCATVLVNSCHKGSNVVEMQTGGTGHSIEWWCAQSIDTESTVRPTG